MKIKGLKIKETNNGWLVLFRQEESENEYVYPSDKPMMMLEEIGKFLIGRKVRVHES